MQIYNFSIPYSNRLIARHINGSRVLDVGGAECIARANELVKVADELVLLDIKPPYQCPNSVIQFVQANIEAPPSSLGKFDHIILSNVLEHVENPKAALLGCGKLLASSGNIHILSPNCESLNRRIGVIMGELATIKAIPDKEKAIGHRHAFTIADIEELIHDTGFAVIEKCGVFLKPVPTPEMIQWPKERIEAFFEVARQIPPELCHEVYFRVIRTPPLTV